MVFLVDSGFLPWKTSSALWPMLSCCTSAWSGLLEQVWEAGCVQVVSVTLRPLCSEQQATPPPLDCLLKSWGFLEVPRKFEPAIDKAVGSARGVLENGSKAHRFRVVHHKSRVSCVVRRWLACHKMHDWIVGS